MFPFKIAKRDVKKLHMIQPGVSDAGTLPGPYSSMSAGITLDYRSIQSGGIENTVPIAYTDDKPKLKAEKAPDFAETGIWLVETPQGIKKMFSDIYNTRWWYEDLDRPTKHHGEGFLGFNKTEALERLAELYPKIDETNEVVDYQYIDGVKNRDVLDNIGNKGRGNFVGTYEDGFDIHHSLNVNALDDYDIPYVCPKCDNELKSIDELIEHLKKEHKIKPNLLNPYVQHSINEYNRKIDKIEQGKKIKLEEATKELWKRRIEASLIGKEPFVGRIVFDDFDFQWIVIRVNSDGSVNIEPASKGNKNDPKSVKMLYLDDDNNIHKKELNVNWVKEINAVDKRRMRLISLGFPNLPQYSDLNMYEQVGERPDQEMEPEFDIFETYFVDDDVIETEDDDEETKKDKKAFPEFGQYYDSSLYEQIIERDDNNTTQQFNTLNTYQADDIMSVVEKPSCPKCKNVMKYDDGRDAYVCDCGFVGKNSPIDVVEVKEASLQKNAFVKNAISYPSDPIVQKLIAIPEVRSLIEQHASGYVDEVRVTTPSMDFQQTQQKIQQDPKLQNIQLEQPSGSPYGHIYTYQDTQSHQHKPLDKVVRIDRITDMYGTLVTILHETSHHRHPEWSESQVQAEAESLAGKVKQHLEGKNAVYQKEIIFVKRNLHNFPLVKCEVASTYSQQVVGLQNHSSLGLHSGMVFVYKYAKPLSFHMASVSFPIDIIFANDNRIVKIYHNCKPGSQDIYSCDKADSVIEVIGNFCAFHTLDVGDHIFAVDDKKTDFIQYIIKRIQELKIEQQKDLDMTDWNIKIVMMRNPKNRFITIDWDDEGYKNKKADLIINPDQKLILEELKYLTLEKLVRHSLLHILAGHKGELPEDKEFQLITTKLFKEAMDKKVDNIIKHQLSINKTNKL
jgi:uncharacterized membrane protein (UPF0127 family)